MARRHTFNKHGSIRFKYGGILQNCTGILELHGEMEMGRFWWYVASPNPRSLASLAEIRREGERWNLLGVTKMGAFSVSSANFLASELP